MPMLLLSCQCICLLHFLLFCKEVIMQSYNSEGIPSSKTINQRPKEVLIRVISWFLNNLFTFGNQLELHFIEPISWWCRRRWCSCVCSWLFFPLENIIWNSVIFLRIDVKDKLVSSILRYIAHCVFRETRPGSVENWKRTFFLWAYSKCSKWKWEIQMCLFFVDWKTSQSLSVINCQMVHIAFFLFRCFARFGMARHLKRGRHKI